MHTKVKAGVDQSQVPLGQREAADDAGGLAHVINNIDEAQRIKAKEEKVVKEAAVLEALKRDQSQAQQEADKAEKTKPALVHTKVKAGVDQSQVPLGQREAADDAGGLAQVINNIDEAQRIKAKEEKVAKEAAVLEALKREQSQAQQEADKAEKTKPALVHTKVKAGVDQSQVPLGQRE